MKTESLKLFKKKTARLKELDSFYLMIILGANFKVFYHLNFFSLAILATIFELFSTVLNLIFPYC